MGRSRKAIVRAFLAACVVAAVGGCGGHADDVGTFVGSCGVDPGTMNCFDYGDGRTTADVMAICPTTYTTTPCPAAGRKTHCIFVDHPVGETDQVFRESVYGDSGEDYCRLNQGTIYPN